MEWSGRMDDTMDQAGRYMDLAGRTPGKKMYAEYQAAFYILSSTQGLYGISAPYVSAEGISFPPIMRKAGALGEPEAMLASISQNLFTFHSKTGATPYMISRLGYPYMEVACNGILVASGGAKVRVRSTGQGAELYLDTERYERTKKIYARVSQPMEQGDRESGMER